MPNVFDFSDFESLLNAVKRSVRQVELAVTLGLSAQMINQIFSGKQHLIHESVRKWRAALKLKREEGDYFELLALICAYPHYPLTDREAMRKRAFHLVGRLEGEVGLDPSPANRLLFRMDPLAHCLTAMTEMNGFPKDAALVPDWAAERIGRLRVLGNLRAAVPPRIAGTWNWLCAVGAVKFSEARDRWLFDVDGPYSGSGRIGAPHPSDPLTLVRAFEDFIDEAVGGGQSSHYAGTVTLPSRALELLERLQLDFLYGETGLKFRYLCNRDALERLKSTDAELFREVLEHRDQLLARGLEIPDCGDDDVDVVVETVLAVRRLTEK